MLRLTLLSRPYFRVFCIVSVLLSTLFEGWSGYQQSLIHALEPLTAEQLASRSHPDHRSVGELGAHIAIGRIDWFSRMGVAAAKLLQADAERLALTETSVGLNKAAILDWLDRSWSMVDGVLREWTVEDLWKTFDQPYQGKVYKVLHQWVLWRIMTHDVHHGGQLCELLYAQGIEPFELGSLGGHLTEPPEA